MPFDAMNMGDVESEYEEIDVLRLVRETDKAVLIVSDFGYDIEPEPKWVPLSCIENAEAIGVGYTGRLYVKTWWLKRNFEE